MASAAETSDAYRHLGMIFYKRAIKYLQSDDVGKLKNDVAHGGPYSAMIGLLVPRLDGRRLYMTRISELDFQPQRKLIRTVRKSTRAS
ncbi:hypothetical protein Forpi1262_v007608 [Fusarium oxysporum f. sp. raphani]|uniref:Uncharacterized protein n=1 Tax=Fusarium oxysporum f. sp. raphani TaxID=96318 RepID=A0A8J5Q2E1_FUSOX|nr:hypothetical protein Forpi1262_v007608 [Fusarium oxysporum f. sp. raphani]